MASPLIGRIRTRLLGSVFPVLFRQETSEQMVRIGSEYGGWWVPLTGFDENSICYLAGVGTDITFDLGIAQRFGCRIWAMDPTPKTISWIASQQLPDGMTFLPIGLAGEEATLRFYAPRDPEHVSHSVTNLQRTDRYFDAQCRTVSSLMKELGHRRLDLLKLDIEGAQHQVIESLLRDGVRPAVICVEFDQPEPLRTSRRSIQRLRSIGYRVAKVERFNVTLVLGALPQD